MTSTRLTQHTRSRKWAAALRAATHRPHRPLQATRGTAPTATRQYIHSVQSSHGTLAGTCSPPPGSASYETHSRTRTRPCTHAHGWAGGCCVVGAPTRSPLGPARGPREPSPPEGAKGADRPPFGRHPLPRYRTRSICRAEGESETAEPDETLPPDSLRISRRPGATRVRPCSPPAPPPWA